MPIVALSRLVLLLNLVSGAAYELPMGIDWDSTSSEVIQAIRAYGDQEAMESGVGVFESDIDARASLVVGQFGVEDANDADLFTVAYFGPNGRILGFYAGTDISSGDALSLLAELEAQHPDALVEYLRYDVEQGVLRTFTLYEANTELVVYVSILDEGLGGPYALGVLYARNRSVPHLWRLFPDDIQRILGAAG